MGKKKNMKLNEVGICTTIPEDAVKVTLISTILNKKGKLAEVSRTISLKEIEEGRQEYEDNCVRYVLSEKGRALLEAGAYDA